MCSESKELSLRSSQLSCAATFSVRSLITAILRIHPTPLWHVIYKITFSQGLAHNSCAVSCGRALLKSHPVITLPTLLSKNGAIVTSNSLPSTSHTHLFNSYNLSLPTPFPPLLLSPPPRPLHSLSPLPSLCRHRGIDSWRQTDGSGGGEARRGGARLAEGVCKCRLCLQPLPGGALREDLSLRCNYCAERHQGSIL